MQQADSPWMLTVTFDRVLFMGDLHMQGLAGYLQSSDYRMLMRNTLQQFGCIQSPDGSFPLASSPLVTCRPGDPGPPDGWRWPGEGPDPHVVLGSAGPYSLFDDITIDSFTAFWVAALADYYRYSGDADFVRPLMPVARRAVAFLSGRTTEDGLYYEPEDQRSNPDAAVPWVANWSPGDIATGVDAFSNAAYHDAMNGLALLEEDVARRPAAARALTGRAERVRQALIAHLWDPHAGAMVLNDQDPRRDHTGDANAGNLMFETLDRQRARSAMTFLGTALATPFGTTSSEYTDNPYRAGRIEGYINSQEALGRMRYGDGEGAANPIRRWWGHMLANGPGTGWFIANNDGSVERGYFANTAWTTALPALSEGVLGVRPLAAGFRRWRVAPQPSGLRWAQGRVPVPGGAVASRWKRTDTAFVLTVEGPAGTEGEVVVPLLGRARAIAMDGRIVWRPTGAAPGVDAERRGDAVVFSGMRGSHTFAWETTIGA
jgi:alpha-L-rhamnosidase